MGNSFKKDLLKRIESNIFAIQNSLNNLAILNGKLPDINLNSEVIKQLQELSKNIIKKQ